MIVSTITFLCIKKCILSIKDNNPKVLIYNINIREECTMKRNKLIFFILLVAIVLLLAFGYASSGIEFTDVILRL